MAESLAGSAAAVSAAAEVMDRAPAAVEAMWAARAAVATEKVRAKVATETAAQVAVVMAGEVAETETVVADWALHRGAEVG